MNITWKEDSDGSKRAYVDHSEIIVRKDKDRAGFVVVVYAKRFNGSSPFISGPFKTESEAMIKAHTFVENHRHDLFQLRPFRKQQKNTVGYKAVILYDSEHDFFTSRVLKVTIPKGTIIHYPSLVDQLLATMSDFKYRAQDAIINYIVGDHAYPIDDISGDDVILSAHCCSQVVNLFLDANGDYLHVHLDKFIEQVKDRGGVYSEGMSIHIPDFSWEDNECGEGFHYFLTCDEARKYSYRFSGLVKALNRYVNKKEERT